MNKVTRGNFGYHSENYYPDNSSVSRFRGEDLGAKAQRPEEFEKISLGCIGMVNQVINRTKIQKNQEKEQKQTLEDKINKRLNKVLSDAINNFKQKNPLVDDGLIDEFRERAKRTMTIFAGNKKIELIKQGLPDEKILKEVEKELISFYDIIDSYYLQQ